jgi:hypothetical protein
MINHWLMRNVITGILSRAAKRLLTAEPGGETFVMAGIFTESECVVHCLESAAGK